MNALAAREHGKADKPQNLQRAANITGGLFDIFEIQPFVRIEIEDQAVGMADRDIISYLGRWHGFLALNLARRLVFAQAEKAGVVQEA